ncbi:MAG: cytochrome c family protein [Acidobacteriia bacterium]|nr:cytochrome c family protein [Terriglobia bacterium]
MYRKRSVVALLMAAFSFFLMTRAGRAEQPAAPPDILILKGCPLGGVMFPHKAHAETHAGNRCETCHHPSRPEKPSTAPQQACRSCHVKPPQPPMKTGTQAAFHNPSATSGTCIDCHLKMNATGKKAPTLCMQCHKKENG